MIEKTEKSLPAIGGPDVVRDADACREAGRGGDGPDRQLRTILDTALDGFWVVDGDGRLVDVNPAYCEMSGYSRDELLRMRIADLEALETPAATARRIRTIRERGFDRFDTRHRRKDGSLVDVAASVRLTDASRGTMVCFFRDVTEERRVARALGDSEALFRALFEDHAAVKLLIDPATGRILGANRAAVAFYGWPRERFVQMRIQEVNVLPPEEVAREMERARSLRRTHFEFRHRLADGSVRDVDVYSSDIQVNGRELLHSVVHDATERRQAEDALRKAQRMLLMLTRCDEAILRATSEERLLADVCRVIVDFGGYRMCWAGVAENDERRTVRPVAHAGQDDGYLSTIDVVWADTPRGQGPTGTALREGRVVIAGDFTAEESLSPWREEALRRGFRSSTALPLTWEGERIGVLSMYSGEVTPFNAEEVRLLRRLADNLAFGVHTLRQRAARARADAAREDALLALSSEQDRFRGLIEGSRDLTLVIDRDGHIQFASPASREVVGLEPPMLTGRQVLDFVHREDHRQARRAMAAALSAPDAASQAELRVRRSDGSWALVESSLRNLLHLPGVGGVVINNRDVTEQSRLREQFQQAQKLESVGRLAGGVAHDFNNLLTVILACAEDVRDAAAKGMVPGPDLADDILDAGRRAGELTKQLLAFARKQVVTPVTLDLNEILRTSEKLLRRVIGEDVRIQRALQPDLWRVRCDPGLLGQVVMNLAVNARDAMPRGGLLTLSTRNLTVSTGDPVPDPEMRPGEYVRIAVEDTGTGIAPEVLAHLFEPFVTTKEKGKGTGLGLATVYGIVRQSGGFIGVRSEAGAGTAFEIFLPRHGAERPADGGEVPAAPRGSETILLVEDEAKVRAVTARMLRSAGYRVLEAESGAQALERVRDASPAPELLVTDVVLPGMNGREIARSLGAIVPGLAVLYISGYTDDAIARSGEVDAGLELLSKPFDAPTLHRRVREVLDRRARAAAPA